MLGSETDLAPTSVELHDTLNVNRHALRNLPSRGLYSCILPTRRDRIAMSKLGPGVKALINAAHARPGPVPAPRHIESIYKKIEREATAHKLGRPSWLALSTATTMTMNSPEAMSALYKSASESKSTSEGVEIAELMREVGLKCIGFNGVCGTSSTYRHAQS